jgi:asparagine synthase (glutamine-hydrolysing)
MQWIHPEWFEASGFAERYNAHAKNHDGKERSSHAANVFHPIQPFALEKTQTLVDFHGMDYKCPFWDKRLVEFCLSLPASQKFKNGWPRSILRRSMENVIPSQVQWRKDKTDFSPNLLSVTDIIFDNKKEDLLNRCKKDVFPWLDLDKMINHYRSNPEKKVMAIFDIWKVLTLHAWLETKNLN